MRPHPAGRRQASLAPHPDFGTVAEIGRRTPLPALDDLDLSAYPRLLALRESPPATKDHSKFEYAARLFDGPGAWPPAQPIETADLRGTGWHSPEVVHWLAVLAERDGSPDARRRLEAVFDLWARAIPERPDPVGSSGKYGTAPSDFHLRTRFFTVAALDRSHRTLGMRDLAAFRGAQMRRLREFLGARLDAIRAGRIPADLQWPQESADGPLHPLVLYGQNGAVAGAAAGLGEAKDLIRAALRRDGGTAGPFGHYREAPVDDRLDLLAVMRGRATWLEPPR